METRAEIRALTPEEIDAVDGGVLPLIAIAAGLGKGFIFGVGVGAAVEVGFGMYELVRG